MLKGAMPGQFVQQVFQHVVLSVGAGSSFFIFLV